MTEAIEIKDLYRLKQKDIEKASNVAARAFRDENLIYNTLIPDENERLKLLPHMYSFLLRCGLKKGEVYSPTEEIEGFAIWLTHKNIDTNFWTTMRNGGFSVYRKLGKQVLNEILTSAEFHRNIHREIIDDPHWYLQFLAIDPQHQGKGYASSLLKAMINRSNNEGLPIYLETQNERNVSIYQHFGFKMMKKSKNPRWSNNNWGMLKKSDKLI